MKNETYALQASEMRDLATGYGGCIATDMITVQGKRVGYMVREPTAQAHDSGWCFMSGEETQDYLDNPENLAIYDVNTIANYSPDIVPFLDAPAGSAFAREDRKSVV